LPGTTLLQLPVGQITQTLSSLAAKNFSLSFRGKSPAYLLSSHSLEGRIAIVTDAGWDAVDADALLTNSAEADGEVVWF
jgi:hypothetical protein